MAGAVAAGALDPDQAHRPESAQPAQQPGAAGRGDGELPDAEQPADRIERGCDVGIGMGVYPAGNCACLYDGDINAPCGAAPMPPWPRGQSVHKRRPCRYREGRAM